MPSYTRYQLSIAEAFKACRAGGIALFSVYSDDSAIYHAAGHEGWQHEDRPIAAIGRRATGKLNVGGAREFACDTFTVDGFKRLVTRFGFQVERVETFPTRYATMARSVVAKMHDGAAPPTRYPNCRTFSPTLYDLNVAFSRANPGRGHYILLTARRPPEES